MAKNVYAIKKAMSGVRAVCERLQPLHIVIYAQMRNEKKIGGVLSVSKPSWASRSP